MGSQHPTDAASSPLAAADGQWGAADALRRNAGRSTENLDATEESPLLERETSEAPATMEAWSGNTDFEGTPWYRRPNLYWLLPPFFCYSIAFGALLVPRLNLILSLICRDYLAEQAAADPSFMYTPIRTGGSDPQCRIPEVQALSSTFMMYILVISGTLSAIVAPRIGAGSDRYGRIRFLVLASAGTLLTEIMPILSGRFPDVVSYKWMLLGAVFDGMGGSLTTCMSLAFAYAADVTPPLKRNVHFGYVHAGLFSGIALGPLLAAFTFKWTQDLLTIFYIALAIHVAFMVFMLLAVPESLTEKRQLIARDKHDQRMNSSSSQTSEVSGWIFKANIFEPLKILWPTGTGSSGHLRGNLVLVAAIDMMIFGIAMGGMTVIVYYSGYMFGWDTTESSLFVSRVSWTRVFALVIALPIFNYFVRTRPANRKRRESGYIAPTRNRGADTLDLLIIRFSILLEVLGCLGYFFARSPTLFTLSGMLAAAGGFGSPTLSSAMTKHVPHDRVGQLLGATGFLHALARIVCPALFNMIYAGTVKAYPQAIFIVLAASFSVAFVFSLFVRPHVYLAEADSPDTNEDSAEGTRADEEATLL